MLSEFPEMNYIGDFIRAKYLKKYLPIGSGNCLDVGAGSGQYFHLITEKGYKYTGFDSSPRHPLIEKGNAEKIEAADNVFDVIVCMDVLEHVENPKKAVKEMFRVLKPSGKLFLHTPNLKQTHILVEPEKQKDHVVDGFTIEELKDIFEKAGFGEELKIIDTFNILECIAWEMVYCQIHNMPHINLDKYIDFDPENYENLGWLVLAEK